MKAIIDECKRVKKYEDALPRLEELVKNGTFGMYCAGSLMLKLDGELTAIDIEPLKDSNSEIFRRGQYLASKILVEHKKGSCFFVQAMENIREYENA